MGEENLFDGIGDLGEHIMNEDVVDLQTESDSTASLTLESPEIKDKEDQFDFGLGPWDNPASTEKVDADSFDKLNDDKEKEDTETTSSPSTTIQSYVNLAENLHIKGVLSSLSKEEIVEAFNKEGADPDEVLIELQQKEIENKIEAHINGLSEDERDLYKAKQVGAPISNIEQINQQLKNYENYDEHYFNNEDNAEIAKRFIKADLINKGIEEDVADSLVDKYEEDNLLGVKAFKVKEDFVATLKNTKSKLIEDAEVAKQKHLESIENHKKELKSIINNTKEIIPGVPLTKDLQNQIYEDFTKPVGKDEKTGQYVDIISATRNKNPDGFDLLLRYYNRIGLFNIDDDGNMKPDFSVINNKLQTEQAKTLKKVLSTDGFKPTNQGGGRQEFKASEDLFGGI